MTKHLLMAELESGGAVPATATQIYGKRPGKAAAMPIVELQPAAIKVAVSAVAWLLAMAWLDLTGAHEIDWTLALATGVFVMVFTLLLAAAPLPIDDEGRKGQRSRCRRRAF